MGERRYSVDPQGDVTLVLRTDPQKDFAVWDENDIPSAISVPGNNAFSPPPGESLQQVGSQQTPRDKSTSVSEPQMVETHYRVSSRHLILASEYFKRTLGPEWKEGATLKSDGHVTVHAEGWDGEAFLILLNIIHGHTRKVPKSIDLDMLAKIALLVDYYQCLEVSELFANIWFEKLIEGVPSTYTRDLILWLFVSWVFRQSELFTRTTKICSTQSRGPIQTLALPIPENFVGNKPLYLGFGCRRGLL
ncbi:hypothetical protein FQN54_006229 [Arachnomyces sp. PD_36]|nr:hypothetical protein FQN54_006229 [Arachnomyces sp. PD_36]